MKKISLFIFLISSFFSLPALCQQKEHVESVAAAVTLDSVVIKATSAGFSVEDFIEMVQTDDSFYKAFKNLRTESYRFDCDMDFFDKRENTIATYNAKNIQWFRDKCRSMETLEETHSGKYFKRKKNPTARFYTTVLYERLFETEGTVCSESQDTEPSNSGQVEDHVSELKKLIFRPGQQANVPLIKNKTAIFSDKMQRYYDFSIRSEEYNGVDCYVFAAHVRPEYLEQIGKTVIKHLETRFSKADFQVVNRTYELSNRSMVYFFEVKMNIDLVLTEGKYFPANISYDGYWNVPMKKYEKAKFTVSFSDSGLGSP